MITITTMRMVVRGPKNKDIKLNGKSQKKCHASKRRI